MPIAEEHPGTEKPETGKEEPARARKSRAMRERAMETSSAETVAGLEQIFEAKLAAVQAYEKRLGSISDPYARQAMQQLIRKERNELLQLADLTELVEQSPDMGKMALARRRFGHRLRAGAGRDMGVWLGAIAVGALLLPGVREQLRPLAVTATNGIMDLAERVQGMVSGMRENIEDLVSEAEFEKLKQSIDASIESDAGLPAAPDEPVP